MILPRNLANRDEKVYRSSLDPALSSTTRVPQRQIAERVSYLLLSVARPPSAVGWPTKVGRCNPRSDASASAELSATRLDLPHPGQWAIFLPPTTSSTRTGNTSCSQAA
jgi:hypothetical protein